MHRGQLAVLPVGENRSAERRIVNLAASLREEGANLLEVEVRDLSASGFCIAGALALDEGSYVWLKLPGLEPKSAQLVWSKGEEAGFEFANPLHQEVLEMLATPSPRGPPKRHFGVQAGR